jgi:chromosome segregation ATPase
MNVQTKFFICAVVLFVVALVFGGFQTCRLSDLERTSGAIADQNKQLADELDVLTVNLANANRELDDAQVVTGNLQKEIGRIRDLYRGSQATRRELAEKLAEFERIIGSSTGLVEQGNKRFDELERGLREIKEIIRRSK